MADVNVEFINLKHMGKSIIKRAIKLIKYSKNYLACQIKRIKYVFRCEIT